MSITVIFVIFFIFSTVLFGAGLMCHYWVSPWPWVIGAVGALGSAIIVFSCNTLIVGLSALFISGAEGLAGYELARMGGVKHPHPFEIVIALFAGILAAFGLYFSMFLWG